MPSHFQCSQLHPVPAHYLTLLIRSYPCLLIRLYFTLLIYNNYSVPTGIFIDPGGVASGQIDAAVAAIKIVGGVAARVAMRELRTRAEALSPPGIMHEIAAVM